MVRRQNITEDAFRFIKYRCIHCREIIPHNKLFCNNNDCRDLYFGKINDTKIKTWTNKNAQSKRRVGLSEILSEENLKNIVSETEKNIDEQMNKSKR